jgi:hypothetical protein
MTTHASALIASEDTPAARIRRLSDRAAIGNRNLVDSGPGLPPHAARETPRMIYLDEVRRFGAPYAEYRCEEKCSRHNGNTHAFQPRRGDVRGHRPARAITRTRTTPVQPGLSNGQL